VIIEGAGRDFDGIEITIMRPPEGNPSRLVREYGAAGAHRILLTSDALSLSPQRAGGNSKSWRGAFWIENATLTLPNRLSGSRALLSHVAQSGEVS
jgi:hypothetical protein